MTDTSRCSFRTRCRLPTKKRFSRQRRHSLRNEYPQEGGVVLALEADVSTRAGLLHGGDVQVNGLAMAAAANVRNLRHDAARHRGRSASRLIGAAVRVKVEVARRFRYPVTYFERPSLTSSSIFFFFFRSVHTVCVRVNDINEPRIGRI